MNTHVLILENKSSISRSLRPVLIILCYFQQLRRQARLRREYLYRKSLEEKERTIYERKKKLKAALEGMGSRLFMLFLADILSVFLSEFLCQVCNIPMALNWLLSTILVYQIFARNFFRFTLETLGVIHTFGACQGKSFKALPVAVGRWILLRKHILLSYVKASTAGAVGVKLTTSLRVIWCLPK